METGVDERSVQGRGTPEVAAHPASPSNPLPAPSISLLLLQLPLTSQKTFTLEIFLRQHNVRLNANQLWKERFLYPLVIP